MPAATPINTRPHAPATANAGPDDVSKDPVDIQTSDDIRRLVDTFYARVRADNLLGLIFDDIAGVDWDAHLPVMYSFWETILLHREGYKGNPIEAHVRLDAEMRFDHNTGLQPADFERWLTIFHSTVDELFCGRRAEMAKRGAKRMGDHMQRAMLLQVT